MVKVADVAVSKRKASTKSTNAFHSKKLVVRKKRISRARRLAKRASIEASVVSICKKIGITTNGVLDHLLPQDKSSDTFLRLSY